MIRIVDVIFDMALSGSNPTVYSSMYTLRKILLLIFCTVLVGSKNAIWSDIAFKPIQIFDKNERVVTRCQF